jgi:hypothetical protein
MQLVPGLKGQKRRWWPAARVCCGTGPRVRFGVKSEVGAHRVSFDISESGKQMGLAQRAGIEAALPQVPAPAVVRAVDEYRILAMGTAEGEGHRSGFGGRHKPVDVVRHEAPAEEGPGRNRMLRGLLIADRLPGRFR